MGIKDSTPFDEQTQISVVKYEHTFAIERGGKMKTVQILRALLKVAEFFGEVQQVHLYDGGLITIDGADYQLQFLRK